MHIRWTLVPMLALALFSQGVAAQEDRSQPGINPANAAPQENDSPHEIAQYSAIGAIDTPLIVRTSVKRNEVFASVDVRHVERRLLLAAAESDHLRIAADTELYRAQFRSTLAQATPITAWCGEGTFKNLYGWRPRPVCLVESVDGQATLALAGNLESEPAWYSSSLDFPDPSFRMPRPSLPRAPGHGPLLKMEAVYAAGTRSTLVVLLRLRGPKSMGRTETFFGRVSLTPQNNQARLDFAGSTLALTLSEDLQQLSAALETFHAATSTYSAEGVATTLPESATKPLPPINPESFVIGSSRLDPSTWSLTSGQVSAGGTLARGFVGYARIGKLHETLAHKSMVRFEAPAGLAMHRFQYFMRDGAGGGNLANLWCGLVSARLGFISNRRTACLMERGGGYMFYPTEEGRTTLMSTGTRFVYPDFIENKSFTIIDQAAPADMPFPLSVILKGVNARAADVEFRVNHDGDTTRIWRADVPFNDGGLAELPLWSRTLQIQRGTDGVSVALVEQNNGLGPVDLFPGGLP